MPTRLRMPPESSDGNCSDDAIRIEIDELQLLVDARFDLVLVHLRVLAQRIGDVLEHRHRVEQRGALKHHAHLLPNEQRFLEAEVGDVVAVDQHASALRNEQAQDQLENRRLAGARLADDDDRLALTRDERHVLDDRDVERRA